MSDPNDPVPPGRAPKAVRRADMATVDEVAGLLAVAAREFPDIGRIYSFSLYGLWRCVATNVGFSEWAAGVMRSNDFMEDVFYIRGTRPDGSPDLFLALLMAPQVARYASPAAREARRVLCKALLDAIPQRGAELDADPLLKRLVGQLSDEAFRGHFDDPTIVRMADGSFRMCTAPDDVANALDVGPRPIGSRTAVSVSVRGLWSCTSSDLPFQAWFARVAGSARLRDGEHYGPDPAQPEGGPAYVELMAAKLLASLERSPSQRAVVAVIHAAIRAAIDRPGVDPAAVTADADGEPAGETSPRADDEPWAEAFEFGRLVPVTDREVGGASQPTVSARDVHRALGLSRQFTNWFDERVAAHGLVACVDYEAVIFNVDVKDRGRGPLPRQYVLTLVAAKKIAMSSETERGNAIREYFIECERRLQAGEPPIPGSVPGPAHQLEPSVPEPGTEPSAVSGRQGQPAMPDHLIPLGMAGFLCMVGLDPRAATALAAVHGPALARSLILDGRGACVGVDPSTGRTCFARPALDAWWQAAHRSLLSSQGAN